MITRYFVGVMCASVLVLTVVAPVAKAETIASTPTIANLMELLQGLQKQVDALKKQLRETQGEIKNVQQEIRSGLKEGSENDDVRKLQELLASDSTLYPRGLITGYYGALTSEAVKRFQTRHGLTVTGVVDDETREYLEEYYKEYKANRETATLWAQEKRRELKQRIEERKQERREKREEMRNDDNNDDSDGELENSPRTVSKALATRAIHAAKLSIANLERALTSGSKNDDDVKDATADLDDANERLTKAEEAFSARLYRTAYRYALKARSDARDGLEALRPSRDDEYEEAR